MVRVLLAVVSIRTAANKASSLAISHARTCNLPTAALASTTTDHGRHIRSCVQLQRASRSLRCLAGAASTPRPTRANGRLSSRTSTYISSDQSQSAECTTLHQYTFTHHHRYTATVSPPPHTSPAAAGCACEQGEGLHTRRQVLLRATLSLNPRRACSTVRRRQ